MFSRLKEIFGFSKRETPTVEITGFRHGLLCFRSKAPLGLKEVTVKTPTDAGTLKAKVDIQSYDPRNQEYLAKVKSDDDTLESLNIDISRIASVSRVLKVSSTQLPSYGGYTEELSPSGLLLSTTEPLPIGKVIDFTLELDLSKQRPLRLKGEVKWSAHKSDGTCHSGIRFKDLSPESMRRLAHYIQLTRQTKEA